MSRTAITPQVPKGPYGVISSGQLDLTETAADTTNNNEFVLTGREVLLAHNTDTGTHHITITSIADAKGRSGDIATYAITAGKISAYSFRGGTEGWQQADGGVYISADDATVKFTVLQLP